MSSIIQIILLLFCLEICQNHQFIHKETPLNPEILIGSYNVQVGCDQRECIESVAYYQDNDQISFKCFQSGENKLSISYSNQAKTYQIQFYKQFPIQLPNISKPLYLYFDQSNIIQEQNIIYIPLSDGLNLYFQLKKSGLQKNKITFLVWKGMSFQDKLHQSLCEFQIEKTKFRKHTPFIKRNTQFYYNQNQLIGKYKVTSISSKWYSLCKNTFIQSPFKKYEKPEFQFKCPQLDSLSFISYNSNNDSYSISFEQEQKKQNIHLQFSKINFTKQNQIRIPVYVYKNELGKISDFYKLSIMPCWIDGVQTSRYCSDDQETVQFSVWKFESKPWFWQPCGWIMTKQEEISHENQNNNQNQQIQKKRLRKSKT